MSLTQASPIAAHRNEWKNSFRPTPGESEEARLIANNWLIARLDNASLWPDVAVRDHIVFQISNEPDGEIQIVIFEPASPAIRFWEKDVSYSVDFFFAQTRSGLEVSPLRNQSLGNLIGFISEGKPPSSLSTLTGWITHSLKYLTSGIQARKETQSPTRNTPAWHLEVQNKISELATLTVNWNGYEAEAPNAVSLDNARAVIKSLIEENLQPSRVLASSAGGVSIVFFAQKRYGEIECYNTGETVAIIKNTATNWRQIWQVHSIPEATKTIRDFLNP